MDGLCCTCLSSGRRLQPLASSRHKHILKIILGLNINEAVLLCWECSALLAKVLRFRLQAARARRLVNLLRNTKASYNTAPMKISKSLSSLSTFTKITYDKAITYDEAEVNNNSGEEVKTKNEIPNKCNLENTEQVDAINEYHDNDTIFLNGVDTIDKVTDDSKTLDKSIIKNLKKAIITYDKEKAVYTIDKVTDDRKTSDKIIIKNLNEAMITYDKERAVYTIDKVTDDRKTSDKSIIKNLKEEMITYDKERAVYTIDNVTDDNKTSDKSITKNLKEEMITCDKERAVDTIDKVTVNSRTLDKSIIKNLKKAMITYDKERAVDTINKVTVNSKTIYKGIIKNLKESIINYDKERQLENHERHLNEFKEEPVGRVEVVDNDEDGKKKEDKEKDTKATDEESMGYFIKQKEDFIIEKMTLEEALKARQNDYNSKRYKLTPFKCVTCIKGFYKETGYKKHMECYHSEKEGSQVCAICAVRFRRENTLRQHYEMHLERFHCRKCSYTHHRLESMVLHTNAKHKVYRCSKCDMEYMTMGKLKYHQSKAHRQKPTCKYCSKVLSSNYSLKKHMELHESNSLQKCPQCDGKYLALNSHLLVVHGTAEGRKDSSCAECGKQFSSVLKYRSHLKLHHKLCQQNACKYRCKHCDVKHASKVDLDRHLIHKHAKQYPFRCNICDKCFCMKNVLRNHMKRKHEGVSWPKNKISCSFCGKGFQSYSVLNIHIRKHTEEKPCAQRAALKTHQRALRPKPDVSSTNVVS